MRATPQLKAILGCLCHVSSRGKQNVLSKKIRFFRFQVCGGCLGVRLASSPPASGGIGRGVGLSSKDGSPWNCLKEVPAVAVKMFEGKCFGTVFVGHWQIGMVWCAIFVILSICVFVVTPHATM